MLLYGLIICRSLEVSLQYYVSYFDLTLDSPVIPIAAQLEHEPPGSTCGNAGFVIEANCLVVHPLILPLTALWVQPTQTLWNCQCKHPVLGVGKDRIGILEVDLLHSLGSFRQQIPSLTAVLGVSYILNLSLPVFLWLLRFCTNALSFLMTDWKCYLSCGVPAVGLSAWFSEAEGSQPSCATVETCQI